MEIKGRKVTLVIGEQRFEAELTNIHDETIIAIDQASDEDRAAIVQAHYEAGGVLVIDDIVDVTSDEAREGWFEHIQKVIASSVSAFDDLYEIVPNLVERDPPPIPKHEPPGPPRRRKKGRAGKDWQK